MLAKSSRKFAIKSASSDHAHVTDVLLYCTVKVCCPSVRLSVLSFSNLNRAHGAYSTPLTRGRDAESSFFRGTQTLGVF